MMKSNSTRKGVLATALSRRQEAFKGGMISFRFPNDGKRSETEKKRRLRMPKNNLRKIACATYCFFRFLFQLAGNRSRPLEIKFSSG
jgi:hypothetical protein